MSVPQPIQPTVFKDLLALPAAVQNCLQAGDLHRRHAEHTQLLAILFY